MKTGEIWECIQTDSVGNLEIGDYVTITSLHKDIVYCNYISIPHVVFFWDRAEFVIKFKKVYTEEQ